MNITIQRGKPDTKQVIGRLTMDENEFACDTLENLNVIIAAGEYACVYNKSPRLSLLAQNRWLEKHTGKVEADCPFEERNVWTFEIQNVPGKTGVRIHSLNYYSQSKACIGLGEKIPDMNGDAEEDIANSRDTIRAFQAATKYKDFTLVIKDYEEAA